MTSQKNNENYNDDEITIKVKKSSVAEFAKHNLPTDDEVEEFDDFVNEEMKDEEVEKSLNEIYRDDKGKVVDVKKMNKAKRHGFVFKFFYFLALMVIIFGGGYVLYNYYGGMKGTNNNKIDFTMEGENEIIAGQEFYYTIYYKNLSNVSINNARIEATYPKNFVFLDSYPPTVKDKNNIWELPAITTNLNGKIKIKGKILGQKDESAIMLANFTYTPENFSSEFKKEASMSTIVRDIGINVDFDNITSSLVGETNELDIRFKSNEKNYINNFRIVFEPAENIDIISKEHDVKNTEEAKYTIVRPGVWQIEEVTTTEKKLPIKFKFTDKTSDQQDIIVNIEQIGGNDQSYVLLSKKFTYEVMKNDLNLTLIINGSRDDKGIDFGQTLNYSIVYKNKGETEMKDVVIMAILKSDFLDWTTLKDEQKGVEKGHTISWSKNEIPSLASLSTNTEGTIDFSIDMQKMGNIESGKDYSVKSYAQFNIGKAGEETKDDEKKDNKSNTITNKINSDLKLEEQLRYFNDDNITVGNGPLPFEAGKSTSLKVYWVLSNNLHELENAKVETTLPENVSWGNNSRASVGSVTYDEATRKVTWFIGRLPIVAYRSDADFSINVTPGESDKDKIMVIKPGSMATAKDKETQTDLSKNTTAQTSKLEDDEIAQRTNDGIVR